MTDMVEAARNIVLLIEDDFWVADYVADVVEAFFEFTVVKADSGQAARRAFTLHSESIVAIISDLTLRDAKGAELVRQLAGAKSNIAIIFITGHVEHDRELSRIVGRPVSLLMKPFGPVDLKNALQNRLDHPPARAGAPCLSRTGD